MLYGPAVTTAEAACGADLSGCPGSWRDEQPIGPGLMVEQRPGYAGIRQRWGARQRMALRQV